MAFAIFVSGDLISVYVTALRTVYMVAVDHVCRLACNLAWRKNCDRDGGLGLVHVEGLSY